MSRPEKNSHKILLGVTGGIAAYKSCEIIREFIDQDCEVRVILSRNAEQFIGRLTLSTLSAHPVLVDPLHEGALSGAEHIDLTRWADLAIVAPATANIIAKAANGIADDFLSTTLCSFNKKRLFAPAMNTRMWENPAVVRNVQQLRLDGSQICDPEHGWLACGEFGAGRMAHPQTIVEQALNMLEGTQELAGKIVLVTAGPTIEDIDDVRFLSNHSTGRMGFAMARAAHRMGAIVRIISGPVSLATPLGVCRTDVRSAAEMAAAVDEFLPQADILIKCAAVADYRPEKVSGKIKKAPGNLKLELKRTRDILASLKDHKGQKFFAGFALEMEDALNYGRRKLAAKGLDLICINDASQQGSGFSGDTNQLTLISANGVQRTLEQSSKDEQAQAVMARIVELLQTS